MSEEEFLERKERSFHRAADRAGLAGRRLNRLTPRVLPVLASIALIAAAVSGLKSTGAPNVSIAGSPYPNPFSVETGTPSASPLPEASVTPLDEIGGPGPLVLYAHRVTADGFTPERWQIFMIQDVGAIPEPAMPPPTFVMEIEGSLRSFYPEVKQPHGNAVVVVADTEGRSRLWVFKRGRLPAGPLVDGAIEIQSAIASPDGSRVAVYRADQPDVQKETLWVYSTSAGTGRPVVELTAPKGDIGIPRPALWRGDDLLAFPSCDCDAGPAESFYDISLTRRRLTKATWLGDPERYLDGAASADGRTMVVVRSDPVPGCNHEFETCVRPPFRLNTLKTGSPIERELARTNELYFGRPALSPDGRFVAFASGRNEEIVVREVSNGTVYTKLSDQLLDFAPLEWISNDTFLAMGRATDLNEDQAFTEILEYVTIGEAAGEESGYRDLGRLLLMESDTRYLGWIR